MSLTRDNRFWAGLYELAWKAALPGLARSSRLREGWSERLLRSGPADRVDLWMQAASVGEAYLAIEILDALKTERPLLVLVTSGTSQGLSILQKAVDERAEKAARTAYFPFDIPSVMKKALLKWRPRLITLLETELWPGLLSLCRKMDIPVLVVNGRLSQKSLELYQRTKPLWKRAAPREIHAVSTEDAWRFAQVFGHDRVQVMNNIKFDRLEFGSTSESSNALDDLIPVGSPFLVLGSVRKDEEGEIAEVLKVVASLHPEAVIGLFPRHMHRLSAWQASLENIGLKWIWRSEAAEPVSPGTVILWDKFGELDRAYARAWAVFVGGSLKPCGGQNFLEALGRGVIPCIGPHWDNFAWVGREIVKLGLVRQAADRKELARTLAHDLLSPPHREEILIRVESYINQRTGGTGQACTAIRRYL